MSLQNQKYIQGLTLIEVIITVLVVAIGMLGMAALQVKTLTSTQESYARSQAVALLEDASGRIRANREFFATDPASSPALDADGNPIDLANPYTNNLASGSFYQWCEVTGAPYEPIGTCTGACSARDLAMADIDLVCSGLNDTGIQGAQIGVSCTDRDAGDSDSCSSGSKLTLYVAWPQIEREDSGDKEITGTRCQSDIPTDLVGDGYSCVIIELIP